MDWAVRCTCASGRCPHPRVGGDAGFTLVELLVSVAVFSVALTMFTTGVLQIFRGTSKIESAAFAQSQMERAFDRLDSEIRYASALSEEGEVDGDHYVEYRTENSGTAVCTQLRLRRAARVADQQLQLRTWVEGTTPITPTPWIPLASGIDGTHPFTFAAADSTYEWQRLTIDLLAASGGEGRNVTVKALKVTFTALNTSPSTSSADVCAAGRMVP